MLAGVTACVAYRRTAGGAGGGREADVLLTAVRTHLHEPTAGNMSSSRKRERMRAFARGFLSGLPGEYHDGLPVGFEHRALDRDLVADRAGECRARREKETRRHHDPRGLGHVRAP